MGVAEWGIETKFNAALPLLIVVECNYAGVRRFRCVRCGWLRRWPPGHALLTELAMHGLWEHVAGHRPIARKRR